VKRVLVGVDGSENSLAALHWAAELAGSVGAELVVAHAVGLLEHMAASDRRADVETWCRPLVGRLPVQTAVRDGPPSLVLAAAAEELECDLIVVGTRGVGLNAQSLGSTTLALLEHARRPVAVLPPVS
jgi:nucleotide-binding universal stress UspA family protein